MSLDLNILTEILKQDTENKSKHANATLTPKAHRRRQRPAPARATNTPQASSSQHAARLVPPSFSPAIDSDSNNPAAQCLAMAIMTSPPPPRMRDRSPLPRLAPGSRPPSPASPALVLRRHLRPRPRLRLRLRPGASPKLVPSAFARAATRTQPTGKGGATPVRPAMELRRRGAAGTPLFLC